MGGKLGDLVCKLGELYYVPEMAKKTMITVFSFVVLFFVFGISFLRRSR